MISPIILRWSALLSAVVLCLCVIFSALANPLPDNDSLPDWWELKYFGNDSQTESGDPDLDGLTNLQEYQLGTNPADPDTDYDGIGDGQELFDGTQPTNSVSVTQVRLGAWHFNSNNWAGLQGQLPLYTNALISVAGINGNAVLVTNTSAKLIYKAAEIGGRGNINCREGTVRFWFKPAWNSSTTNNGTGPQSEAALIELGVKAWPLYGFGDYNSEPMARIFTCAARPMLGMRPLQICLLLSNGHLTSGIRLFLPIPKPTRRSTLMARRS